MKTPYCEASLEPVLSRLFPEIYSTKNHECLQKALVAASMAFVAGGMTVTAAEYMMLTSAISDLSCTGSLNFASQQEVDAVLKSFENPALTHGEAIAISIAADGIYRTMAEVHGLHASNGVYIFTKDHKGRYYKAEKAVPYPYTSLDSLRFTGSFTVLFDLMERKIEQASVGDFTYFGILAKDEMLRDASNVLAGLLGDRHQAT